MKLLLLLAALVALVLFAISLYNALITARNAYRNAFAQIDVQLNRRYDLIPNLVEAVKGYLQHERETLQAVMAARQQAQSGLHQAKTRPEDPVARAALEQGEQRLGSALGRLFAVSEAYPELKANETVLQLMEELSSTENRLAYARQAHNDAVMDYNNRCETFPGSLVARRFGFRLAQPLAQALARVRLSEDLEAARLHGETEQLRSALLASVSHDLRTPLTVMRGSIDALATLGDAIPASDRQELLDATRQEAERLDRYIQNLLDMTRLGHGSLQLARDWVDPGDILASAMQRLQPAAERIAGSHPDRAGPAAALGSSGADRTGAGQCAGERHPLLRTRRPAGNQRAAPGQ